MSKPAVWAAVEKVAIAIYLMERGEMRRAEVEALVPPKATLGTD